MNSQPFIIHTLINLTATAYTLVDNDCLSYETISEKFIQWHGLQTYVIKLKLIQSVTRGEEQINQVVWTWVDIKTHSEEGAYFYIISDHFKYDLIFEKL